MPRVRQICFPSPRLSPHARALAEHNHPRSHLKPGGYLEHSEINPVTRSDDGTKVAGDTFDEAGKLAIASGERSGKVLAVQPHIKDMIIEAGFADVVEHTYKWPIGDWPADSRLKEMGALNARHWIEGIEAWTMRSLTQLFDVSAAHC